MSDEIKNTNNPPEAGAVFLPQRILGYKRYFRRPDQNQEMELREAQEIQQKLVELQQSRSGQNFSRQTCVSTVTAEKSTKKDGRNRKKQTLPDRFLTLGEKLVRDFPEEELERYISLNWEDLRHRLRKLIVIEPRYLKKPFIDIRCFFENVVMGVAFFGLSSEAQFEINEVYDLGLKVEFSWDAYLDAIPTKNLQRFIDNLYAIVLYRLSLRDDNPSPNLPCDLRSETMPLFSGRLICFADFAVKYRYPDEEISPAGSRYSLFFWIPWESSGLPLFDGLSEEDRSHPKNSNSPKRQGLITVSSNCQVIINDPDLKRALALHHNKKVLSKNGISPNTMRRIRSLTQEEFDILYMLGMEGIKVKTVCEIQLGGVTPSVLRSMLQEIDNKLNV